MPFILPGPTQTRNSGRAEHCLVVQRQWRWNRGATRYWDRTHREKGPIPATKYFSGNGIAVAALVGSRRSGKMKSVKFHTFGMAVVGG